MICERCGHEHGGSEPVTVMAKCIANLRADLDRCNADASTIENHMRERLAGLEADLDLTRAELKTEQALSARLEREHGNCHAVGAERLATILRMEKDLGDLLTAVRRLCKAASELAATRIAPADEQRRRAWDALRAALADSALASFRQ